MTGATRAETEQRHREWFADTGHCGLCGQPGRWCQCTPRNPCGCAALHEMGSGIGADPLETFADIPVSDDQEVLPW